VDHEPAFLIALEVVGPFVQPALVLVVKRLLGAVPGGLQ